MRFVIVPIFYALVAMATLCLGLLCCARATPTPRTRIVTMLIVLSAVSLLFVPMGGLALRHRAFSFFPNPSLLLLGAVWAALWQRLAGAAIFKPADWRALWTFGAVAGTVLYLHPMVFGALDLYYWGWHRESAIWVLVALAVPLLACGSRLGVLFLAALMAYAVNALESQNCWDYIMDPVYWIISVAVVAARGFAKLINVFKQTVYG